MKPSRRQCCLRLILQPASFGHASHNLYNLLVPYIRQQKACMLSAKHPIVRMTDKPCDTRYLNTIKTYWEKPAIRIDIAFIQKHSAT